jgi:hypothetical protein
MLDISLCQIPQLQEVLEHFPELELLILSADAMDKVAWSGLQGYFPQLRTVGFKYCDSWLKSGNGSQESQDAAIQSVLATLTQHDTFPSVNDIRLCSSQSADEGMLEFGRKWENVAQEAGVSLTYQKQDCLLIKRVMG